MTFPETNSMLRIDLQLDEIVNEEHDQGESAFAALTQGVVTQFPVDYMHSVCLVVMKRLLWLWTKVSDKQSSVFIPRVSERLANGSLYLSREFLRKGTFLFGYLFQVTVRCCVLSAQLSFFAACSVILRPTSCLVCKTVWLAVWQ